MAIKISEEELERRLVRYQDLIPCTTAFIDTKTPGNQKENFTIIGPGVAENPEQHVHINIPHGFNIGGVRQQPHSINSQHSHLTAEVFIVQNSQWAFRWGVDADAGEVIIGPGDVISIPTNLFRGFENVGTETGYMCSVLGGDDPGRVTWAPVVFEMAEKYGLILLEDGRLVDTGKGETVPDGISPMPVTTDAEIAKMRKMTKEEMLACVYFFKEQSSSASELVKGTEIEEIPVIGAANPVENISSGKMTWSHGFHLRRLNMPPGGIISTHHRLEEEVIYIFEGSLSLNWKDGNLVLNRGDVLTIPRKLDRFIENTGSENTIAYVVRGGDNPSAPQWTD